MASWQAHLVDLIVRLTIKRRLKGEPSLEQVRATIGRGGLPAPKGVQFRAATVGGVDGEWAETPDLPGDAPVLLYLHGGGYFACNPQTHRPLTGYFARAGFRVFAPDYRLAPEHPFPAALTDAVAVYGALLESGCKPARLVLAGDSAGGGLSAALLVRARELGMPQPAACCLLSPWTDLAGTGASVHENARWDAMFHADGLVRGASFYVGDHVATEPLISPLYAELHGLAPLLIHAGAREILRDDSTRFAERARAAGGEVELQIWPVVPHVWQLLHHVLPEGRRSLERMAAFMRGKIS